MIALNRKNALFAGHDAGAENWACLASLIETCKLNGIDPQCLSHRRPDQARQPVAGSADRRVVAVGVDRRRQQRRAGRVTDAFAYAELDEILRGAGRTGAIGMSAIDGLIAALVAAPSFVHPEEWIPLTFGVRQPLHENSPELRAVKTIFNRYNEVSETLADWPPAIVRSSWSLTTAAASRAIGRLASRSGSGCAPRNGENASCSPSTASRWSRSWSTARASSISCRRCRPRKSAGGKLPPTQRSPKPSPPPALSATPIAPPKRAGNPSNDAAPTARASSLGGRVASGQAPQTVLTAHRLLLTMRIPGEVARESAMMSPTIPI